MADDELRRLARSLTPIANELFSLDVLHAAARLAKDDPAALTDTHIQHVLCYQPGRALELVQRRAEAIEQRRDAALAAVQARAVDIHTGRIETGLIVRAADTAAAPPPPPTEPFPQEGSPEQMLEWLIKDQPDAPVSFSLFATLHKFVMAGNERNKERNTKIAALEERTVAAETKMQELVQRCALLETRVAFETRLASVEAALSDDKVRR